MFWIKRIGYALVLLLAVIVLNFLLIHISPGDPVETIAGSMGGMTEELKEELRRQFGLDKPFIVQLGIYLGKILQGDFGFSYYFNTPVTKLIIDRKSTRLNSSHVAISYAVFCLKKKRRKYTCVLS